MPGVQATQPAPPPAARSQRAGICTRGAAEAAAVAAVLACRIEAGSPPTRLASDYVCFKQHFPRCAL